MPTAKKLKWKSVLNDFSDTFVDDRGDYSDSSYYTAISRFGTYKISTTNNDEECFHTVLAEFWPKTEMKDQIENWHKYNHLAFETDVMKLCQEHHQKLFDEYMKPIEEKRIERDTIALNNRREYYRELNYLKQGKEQ